MHIVYISREYIPSKRAGGIASYIYTVATNLVKLGNVVTVICASDDTNFSSDTIEEGVHVIRLSGGDFFLSDVEKGLNIKKFRFVYRFHSYRKKVAQCISQLKDIDIIESSDFGAEDIYLLKQNRIPIVLRLHTPIHSFSLTLKSKFLSVISPSEKLKERLSVIQYITACSNNLKNEVCQFYNIPNFKITTIYNPVIIPKETLAHKSSNSAPFRICNVGTVTPSKGIEELIYACQSLVNKNWQIDLTIAGKMSIWAYKLKDRLEKEKITWIHFVGKVPYAEVCTLYQESDIACFPSWKETFGLVCAEAMMCGPIVIGSSSGGMVEIIEDEVDGFLVEPKNSILLADKIESVLNLSEEVNKKITIAAQRKVIDKFDAKLIVKQMLEYYDCVISDFQSKIDARLN